jgi:hypothetical protein
MTHRFAWIGLVLGALICVIAPAPALVAQDADIVGAWDVTVMTGQGPETSAPLLLKRDGDQIVGTFSSPQGAQSVEASVKDNAVTIWFSVRTQNGPIDITMKGTAEGNTMKGSMDFGGRGQGQWLARRSSKTAATAVQAAGSRVDVSGTWSFQVEVGGNSGTPTMTFKQDGEKLSGHYSGQLGEAPLTGTVKGTAIESAIDVSLEGNALHIVYSGTVEKDSMKGTVNFGDVGEGTFTAKRKQ